MEITRSEFYREFPLHWHIGQHVTLVGTTGDGKTVLAEHLYSMREWVVVIASKAKDESLEGYGKDFHRISKWPPEWYQKKILFWKKPDTLGDFSEQREAFYKVLNDVYKHGGRVVGLDDVAYLTGVLHMDEEIRMLCTQSRSQDISLVMNIQRPYRVPLEVTNQSSHVMLFGLRDEKDVDRVVEAQGLNRYIVKKAIASLHKYDFAWIRTKMDPIIVRNDYQEDKKK